MFTRSLILYINSTASELFKEGYDVAMYKIPVEADSAIESALP